MNNIEKYNQFVSDINPTNTNSIYYLIKICAFIDKLFSEEQKDLFVFLTYIIKNDFTLRKTIFLTLGKNYQIPSVVLDNDMALLIINLFADLEKINIEEQKDDIITRITVKEENLYQNDSQVSDIITDFKKKMLSYPLLTQNELIELHDKFFKGDALAKELIIYHNLRLVYSIARRYIGRGVPFEDLLQEGTIGLMKAIDKYNPEKGAFSTCATWWISQSVRRSIGDNVKTFRLPAHIQELVKKVVKSKERLEEKYPENPQLVIFKVAEELNITEDKVKECLKIFNYNKPERLDNIINNDSDTTLGELIADEFNTEEEVFYKNLREGVKKALNDGTLNEQEKNIIILRLGLMNNKPKTLEQIGKIYGISRERVRQIEKKILKKLKKDQNFESLRQYIVNYELSDSKNKKVSFIVNPNECGLFTYFSPDNISKKMLFIIIGLLNENDIKLVIETFGERLNKNPSFITKRIETIIKINIPETYILYNKFITNLYEFLNCSSKEKIEKELENFSELEKDKIFKLFNCNNFEYQGDSNIPFLELRNTFILLNKIRIKFCQEKINETEPVNKVLYFISKKRLQKDLKTSMLNNLSIRLIELKYGLCDGKEYSYSEICERLKMDYKQVRNFEKNAFNVLYGKNRFKIINFECSFINEPLENLNIYKNLPTSIDENIIEEKEFSSAELKALIENSSLTELQKCFLKVRFELPLENNNQSFLTIRDFFINPVGASNLTNSILGKLFSTKYKIKIQIINQNKKTKTTNRKLSNYFSEQVVNMLNSIIIFLSDDEKILLKKAFGNNLSLSLNDELTSDEYQRLNTIITIKIPEIVNKFKSYQKGLLSFFSHSIRYDIISEIEKLDYETKDFIYQNFDQPLLKFIGNLVDLKEHRKAFKTLMEIEKKLEENRQKMKKTIVKHNNNFLIITKIEMIEAIRKSNLSSYLKEILISKYALLYEEIPDVLEICSLANIPVTDLKIEINNSLKILYGPLITINSLIVVDNEIEKEVILKNIIKFKSLPAYTELSRKISPKNQDIIFYIMITILSQNINIKSLKEFIASKALTKEEQRLIQVFNKEIKNFTDECIANLWCEDKEKVKELQHENIKNL